MGPEAVWPYFVHHLDMLIEAFKREPDRKLLVRPEALFRASATLPRPSRRLVDILFELALGPGKTDRPGAQAALASVPGYEERVRQVALPKAKPTCAPNAARWLGRLRHTPAVRPLEIALACRKERRRQGRHARGPRAARASRSTST